MPTKRLKQNQYTTEYFIKMAKIVNGDKWDYSKVIYINCYTKVIIGCPVDGYFLQTPANHLRGQGCPICGEKLRRINKTFTIEEFIAKSNKIHKNKYDYSKVIYSNSKREVIIICPIHGEFLQKPSAHLGGQGCPICGGSKKLTTDTFIVKAIKVHGDYYDYSKVVYINSWTKVKIICPIHGAFWQTPNSHIMGCGCRKCSDEIKTKKNRFTIEEFIIRARKVHYDKYDYSKVIYVNCETKVIIICPFHGEFTQSPHSHLNGDVCPKCSINAMLTTEQFIIKAIKIHCNKYDYSKVDYKGVFKNIIIICPFHGEFTQMPSNHLRGNGCPICQASHGERTIAKFLNDNNIKYIPQKRFKDCINPKTNWPLKYDFCLDAYDMLIEYNGIQHYKHVKRWHKGKYKLADQQYRDSIKKEYALSHGYRFLVIKYTEKNIEQVLLDALGISPTISAAS